MDDKEIYNLIINYNKYIWEERLSKEGIVEWFKNFRGNVIDVDKEQEIALDLLSNFVYYNEDELKYLCRNSFIMFKQAKIKDFLSEGYLMKDVELLFEEFLDKCKFTHIGRPSESGCYMLYHFRHVNSLSLARFLERWNEITVNIESLILVDDFLGTGDTAIRFWSSPIIQEIIKNYSSLKFYYIVLIALERGMKEVEKNTNLKVICPQIFDEEHRVFSDRSFVFPEKGKRDLARQICEKYGGNLEGKKYALGYKDSEALLGLHHNIPNNTLPIIWSDKKGWFPLFHRERKVYR